MVAYSCKSRFVEPIRLWKAEPLNPLAKTGTIRAHRKRHARPGEMVQLYCGMRTRSCYRIIDDVLCQRVNEIIFDLRTSTRPFLISNGVRIEDREARHRFARADGFHGGFEQMVEFWLNSHGPSRFEGVHILWG